MRALLRYVILGLALGYGLSANCVFAQISYTMQPLPVKTGANCQIATLSNGDFVVLETVPQNQFYTIILSRYDGCSQPLWQKKITSNIPTERMFSDQTYLCDLISTEDDGILVAYTDKDVKESFIISKINVSGNIDWSQKTELPYANMQIYSLKSTRLLDNSFLIAGTFDSIKTDITGTYIRTQHFAMRLSKKGKPLWSKSYDAFNQGLRTMGNSDIVYTLSPMRNNACGLFGIFGKILIDSAGNIIDAKSNFDAGRIFYNQVLCAAMAGNSIYAAGTLSQRDSAGAYGFLCKMDMDGKVIWSYYFSKAYGLGFIYDICINQQSIILAADIIRGAGRTTALIECDLDGKFLGAKYFSGLEDPKIFGHEKFLSASQDGNSIFCLGKEQWGSSLTRLHKIYKGVACKAVDVQFRMTPFTLPKDKESLKTYPGLSIGPAFPTFGKCEYKPFFLCESSPIPVADLGPDTILCTGKNYTLGVRKKLSSDLVTWNTGSTDTGITVTKSGTYWVRIATGYCVSTDTVTVVFKSELKIDLGKDLKICPNDSVQLSVSDSFGVPFAWTTPKKSANGTPGISHGNVIWAKDTGNYYLSVDISGACAVVDSIHVGHYFLPVASAGPDTTLCYGEEYTMQGAGGISYRWIPAKFLSNDTIPNPIASPPQTQPYILVVRNAFGCADTSEVQLKVRPPLSVSIDNPGNLVCSGDPLTLTANATGGMLSHYTYTWVQDNTTGAVNLIHPKTSMWHVVKLEDGCSPPAYDSVYITVPELPEADFSITDTAFLNNRVSFLNHSKKSLSYIWSFGDGTESLDFAPVHQYTDTGDFKVILVAFNKYKCRDSAVKQIKVIDPPRVFIPNSFSPNGDMINDVFSIKSVGISTYSIMIYNRWGELIFKTDIPAAWDGTFRGKDVPEGVYLYQVQAKAYAGTSSYYTGTIQLMR
jgi:gliding motility-associated-like protein